MPDLHDPASLKRLAMYIDGERTPPASGEYFETFDPFTARPWSFSASGM